MNITMAYCAAVLLPNIIFGIYGLAIAFDRNRFLLAKTMFLLCTVGWLALIATLANKFGNAGWHFLLLAFASLSSPWLGVLVLWRCAPRTWNHLVSQMQKASGTPTHSGSVGRKQMCDNIEHNAKKAVPFSTYQRRVLKIIAALLILAAAAWTVRYFTASIDERPRILKLAMTLFCLSFFGGVSLIFLFRRFPSKDTEKKG